MMWRQFQQRSAELEHIDKGDYTAEEYEGCLIELRRVNKYLGDAVALRRSLLREIEESKLEAVSVLDVGAGSGELLRVAARRLRARRVRARLVGLEYNMRSAVSIAEESESYAEISAVRADAFALPFAAGAFDYAICSLFAHHFGDEKILAVLAEMSRVARRLFVIDLHRHPIAYLFYTTIGRLFIRNRLVREDGALSIRRGFRPHELRNLATEAKLQNVRVVRRFPFRLVLSGGG